MIMTKKELFLGAIEDAIGDALYYNRIEDKLLTSDDVEELMEEVTLKEILSKVKSTILENYPEIKK
jgi:hypothetical protein